MNESWRHQRIQLEFKFAGLTLFKVPLVTMMLKDHFTTLKNPQELLPPDIYGKRWVNCSLISAYPVQKPLARLRMISGYLRYSAFQYFHYYIEIQGSFSDYLQKFSHKARYNLLRTVRLYNEFCGNQKPWKEYCRAEEMDDFYHLASQVSEKTYQERVLDAGLPKGLKFFKKMKQLAAKNAVLGYILFHDTNPVAYIYCMVTDKSIVSYAYVGYDPKYAPWSPGRVLLYYLLENLFNKGVPCIFDFTRGGGPGGHKDFFSNNKVLCAELYYFKWSLRNFFIILTHMCIKVSSEWFTRLLVFLNIKDRLVHFVKNPTSVRAAKTGENVP
ncbi:MAG: GNAT family N-acetyltransferase [Candidatus Omnitrophica bacterium]|nr:GNAT family N-acetyltransferase [Candidatus Omnitrophota bacterium]